MGPTGATRVLQIHPTRRCNLRCLHCYSSSSPEERDMLDVTLLTSAVRDAAAAGYNWLSLSGGEPLMYPPLAELLAHAHECGMRTTLVSNGMLLDARRLEALTGVLDLLVISIDGMPASHNAMRGSERAFELMHRRLPEVRAHGLDFGFIFTLTQHNLDELQWVVEFALAQGARMVQVHPLEEAGQAVRRLAGRRPDELEAAYAWLFARQLEAQTEGRVALQVDVVCSEALKRHPERFYATPCTPADMLSPLVIEADGTVVPLQYGFNRAYALGRLGRTSLGGMLARWPAQGAPAFHALCRGVQERALRVEAPHFFNWYERVAEAAEREAPSSRPMLAHPH